jgi:hypothetical protein
MERLRVCHTGSGFLGSLVPIAACLNPVSTTGCAVQISKYFNIQPLGMQSMLTSMVASGLTMEEARAVRGGPILKHSS